MPLLKSKIAKFEPYSDEWFASRGGRFTGSLIGRFMLPKGLDTGARTWIREKVGETLAGRTWKTNVSTTAIVHGVLTEPEALKYFKRKYYPDNFIVNQCTIIQDERFSVTPDALIVKSESSDELSYTVETVEVKCLQNENHVELLQCETPKDLLKVSSLKFWQVISQMQWADAAVGHFLAFHPDFPEPYKLHRIIFKKRELIDEFKLFNTRIEEARDEYNKLYNYFLNKKQ